MALANIVDGQAVLEVGCGFGGTISLINEEFHDLKIVGVNIDQRQIDQAKQKVFQNGNDISFIQGDACKLPLMTILLILFWQLNVFFTSQTETIFLVKPTEFWVEGN